MVGLYGTWTWDPNRPLPLQDWNRAASGTRTLSGAGAWFAAASSRALPVALAEDPRLVTGVAGRLDDSGALARRLAAQGHHLTDWNAADLVRAAYREWGGDCVDQLRGPFVAVVFDREARTGFMIRDAVGRVPLFVARAPGRLSFSTSLPTLLRGAAIPRVLDPEAAGAYFRCGFIPAPRSGVRGVSQLEPAEVQVHDGQAVRSRVQREPFGTGGIEGDPLDALQDVLRSVLSRTGVDTVLLRASVPSQLLIALCPGKVRTVAPWTPEDHPLPRIANLQGTEHERVAIDVSVDAVQRLGVALSLPHAAPDWIVSSSLLRSQARVGTADGAEAAFAVDPGLTACLVQDAVRSALPWVQPLDALGQRSPLRSVRRWTAEPSRRLLELHDAARVLRCLQPDFRQVAVPEFEPPEGPDALSRLQDLSLRRRYGDDRLPAWFDLAVHMDTALELPFLAPSVLDLARRLPPRARVDGGQTGTALRQLAQRVLPGRIEPDFDDRPDPGAWLRGPLLEMAEDAFFSTPGGWSGLLETGRVRRRWYEHQAGVRDHGPSLWTLLMFEVWSRQLFRAARPDIPTVTPV